MSFARTSNRRIRVNPEHRIPFELSSVRLTENGFTPEFESAVLTDLEECYAGVANGTLKPYQSVAEMRAALDAEEDDA